MSELYSLKNIGDYTLFLPPTSYCENPDAPKRRAAREAANNAFIDAHKGEKPRRRISGSFIYAHPPNYKGAEAFRYTEEDWTRELTRLVGYGIDTVIFQASMWNELHECYYPSKVFADYKQWDVVGPMLRAANKLGLTIYLGGYGSVTCWMEKLNAGIIESEVKRQYACFEELYSLYAGQFHGFYFSPESAFTGKRNIELENYLGDLYHGLFTMIRGKDPSLKIMMSPATMYYAGVALEEMEAAWSAMFAKAQPDILAPQDSIGCGCITLDHQDEAFQAWTKLCKKYNIRFWSNVEDFECCEPYYDETARRAASPERIICQINNADKYAEKLISWEVLYYTSKELHPYGQRMTQVIFENAEGEK